MVVRILSLLCFIPALVFSQDYTFYNKGAGVFIQEGALVHIQGKLTNAGSGANRATIENEGIIELKGDLENSVGDTFRVKAGVFGNMKRAVRFIGDPSIDKQVIAGDFASPIASLNNLIIDQLDDHDTVEMRTNVNVDGSLIWGSTQTTLTYDPNIFFPTQGTNGLLKTYSAGGEYILDVKNGNTDAIKGYPTLGINQAPTTAFIVTKGTRGSQNGGFKRMVTNQAPYDFPIGTADNGYNAVRLDFSNIPGGGGSVKGKFCDSTTSARGYIGTIAQQCIGCTPAYPTPDNTGYNHYFASSPCNGQPQWLILEESGILEHGYWSFDADNNNLGQWKYVIETFPNSFLLEGSDDDTWRTIKYHDTNVPANQEFGVDPSDLDVNWGAQIAQVENPTDLLTYTRTGNVAGSCYMGDGIPGGVYTDFSHFSMHKSNSSNALPVELIYLKAEPVDNKFIKLSWATALEVNNDGFEVLRSTDGTNFTNVGWVDGNDNATTTISYSFDDNNVVPNVVYYYRLRQVDNDGASEETYVVSAAITSGDVFVVSDLMPNPTRDISRFTITTSTKGNIDVKVFDNIGRLVIGSQSYNLTEGQNDIYVNGSNFAAGTYNIVISTANNVYSKKLVVSHQ